MVTRIEIKGWGEDGQMLVACGDKALCFENKPAPIIYKTHSPLPPVPKVETGQPSFLGIQDGQPAWVTKKGVTANQSAGISLLTVLAIVIAYDKYKKRKGEK